MNKDFFFLSILMFCEINNFLWAYGSVQKFRAPYFLFFFVQTLL